MKILKQTEKEAKALIINQADVYLIDLSMTYRLEENHCNIRVYITQVVADGCMVTEPEYCSRVFDASMGFCGVLDLVQDEIRQGELVI